MATPTDLEIEGRALHFLRLLGCPGARRGQGAEEWRSRQGSYRFTPDLVAGPLVGNGAPEDFLIDVFQPSGDWYTKPMAGDPEGAKFIKEITSRLNTTTTFDMSRLDDGLDRFFVPINRKVERYSGSRDGSPMLGLVMYLGTDNPPSTERQLAYAHSLSALDRGFRLFATFGDKIVTTLFDRLIIQTDHTVEIAVVPFPVQLSFLLWCSEPGGAFKIFLLINGGVVHPEFIWRRHPVVRWLTRMRATPRPILMRHIGERFIATM